MLADEPTGSLDPKTAGHVFGTLTELVKASRVAALVAAHNLDLAARMDRRVTRREGRVEEIGRGAYEFPVVCSDFRGFTGRFSAAVLGTALWAPLGVAIG